MSRKTASPDGCTPPIPGDAELAAFGRKRLFTPAQTQQVLGAVAPVQAQRNRVAAAAARGEGTSHTKVVARGSADIQRWLLSSGRQWNDFWSVRPWGRVEELRISLPHNRRYTEEGRRMISVFDYQGTTPHARLLLSAEQTGRYLFAYAPLQMKIMDNRQVMLDGPVISGEPTVMITTEPGCVAAALAYWRTVLDTSFPCSEAPERVPDLTDRQRQVIALLSADLSDEQIATSIGVSVRTVRADIARVMEAMGVRSRFSLGQAVNDRLTDPAL